MRPQSVDMRRQSVDIPLSAAPQVISHTSREADSMQTSQLVMSLLPAGLSVHATGSQPSLKLLPCHCRHPTGCRSDEDGGGGGGGGSGSHWRGTHTPQLCQHHRPIQSLGCESKPYTNPYPKATWTYLPGPISPCSDFVCSIIHCRVASTALTSLDIQIGPALSCPHLGCGSLMLSFLVQ